MGNTIKKDTIYAKGIDIGIYTADFQNEFISFTMSPTKWINCVNAIVLVSKSG